MKIRFQPVRVDLGEEGDGLLVLRDEVMVGLLVRLCAEHGRQTGHWFLEVGFGPLQDALDPTFADVSAAERWIRTRLEAGRPEVGVAEAQVVGEC
jgi:hypothetical protein